MTVYDRTNTPDMQQIIRDAHRMRAETLAAMGRSLRAALRRGIARLIGRPTSAHTA